MLHERCVHIVDDEAKVRDALTLLLSTAQIESRSYGSAEEYLTSNPLKDPACILLDNQLPGMSGIELLRRIVAATRDSTVIMITAYGDVPTAVLAMKAGAFHFVQKPFDAEALLATVEEALSRERRAWRRSARNEGIQGPAGAAHTARAGGPHPFAGGIADQADRAPVAHQFADRRTSQGRRYSEDASAQHFPPHAHGVRCEKSQQRRADAAIASHRCHPRFPTCCRPQSLRWLKHKILSHRPAPRPIPN